MKRLLQEHYQNGGNGNDLPDQLKLYVLLQVRDMKTLRNICTSSKLFRRICKNNWEVVIENVLRHEYGIRKYSVLSMSKYRPDLFEYSHKNMQELFTTHPTYLSTFDTLEDAEKYVLSMAYKHIYNQVVQFYGKNVPNEVKQLLGQIQHNRANISNTSIADIHAIAIKVNELNYGNTRVQEQVVEDPVPYKSDVVYSIGVGDMSVSNSFLHYVIVKPSLSVAMIKRYVNDF